MEDKILRKTMFIFNPMALVRAASHYMLDQLPSLRVSIVTLHSERKGP